MPGVTATGFEAKTFNEIKEDYESDFRDIFGPEINLSSTSLLGGLIGIFANNDSQLWELGSAVYLSRWVNTATGQALDNNVNFLGINRKQDFRTSGDIYIFGSAGVTVPEGTVFSTQDGLQFINTSTVTLVSGTPPIMRISKIAGFSAPTITLIPSGNLYGLFQPVGTVPSFNFDQNTDEIKVILEGYFGENTIASVTRSTDIVITFSSNLFLPALSSDGVNISFDQIGMADGISLPVFAQESGPFNVKAGQLNSIDTPAEGIERVLNFEDFVPGRYAETDEELRLRWLNRVTSPITSTKDSIRNAIESLPGVSDASIFDIDDNSDIPPLTIDIVVNGGDENDIAQAIYNTKPPGVRVVAQLAQQSITGNATDSFGNLKPIIFSRPDIVPAVAKITLQKLSNYPDNGDNAIRQAIANLQERLPIGSVIRPSPDMIWALNGIMGINSLNIEISVNGGDFSSEPYQLRTSEIINFTSIIIVEVD